MQRGQYECWSETIRGHVVRLRPRAELSRNRFDGVETFSGWRCIFGSKPTRLGGPHTTFFSRTFFCVYPLWGSIPFRSSFCLPPLLTSLLFFFFGLFFHFGLCNWLSGLFGLRDRVREYVALCMETCMFTTATSRDKFK